MLKIFQKASAIQKGTWVRMLDDCFQFGGIKMEDGKCSVMALDWDREMIGYDISSPEALIEMIGLYKMPATMLVKDDKVLFNGVEQTVSENTESRVLTFRSGESICDYDSGTQLIWSPNNG